VRKGKQSKEFEKYSEDFRNVEVSRIEMETMILKTKENFEKMKRRLYENKYPLIVYKKRRFKSFHRMKSSYLLYYFFCMSFYK
jgi:hypothetical protein